MVNEIGNIRESTSFSNSLQGLFKLIVFYILKYAFLAFSAKVDMARLKLPLHFNIIPR
jgi:hypothetical protein